MPAAIGALALTLVTAAGLTGTTALIAANLLTIAIGVGLSYGASALLSPKNNPKPSDRKFLVKSSVAPRTRTYGRDLVTGAQVFSIAKGGRYYRVSALHDGEADAIEAYYVDDRTITLDGSGFATDTRYQYGFVSRLRVETRLGAPGQTHYANLTAAFPDWDSAHVGQNCAHSLFTLRAVPLEAFSKYFPQAENTQLKVLLRGAKIEDPRDDTTGWTDNAALIIRDFLTADSGFRMPAEFIDDEADAWREEADVCDEAVPLKAGGTEPRWRIGYTYGYDQRPADVMQALLAACNGKFTTGQSGGVRLWTGRWIAPEVTLGGATIESYQLSAGNDGMDTANTVRAVYASPAHKWVEQDADPWVNEADVIDRGTIVADVPVYAVQSHAQARRLMKQAANKLAPKWKGQLVCNLAALPVLSERFVTIQIDELGLEFTAEVDAVEFRTDGGSIVTGLVIDFTSATAETFAWDAAAEEGTAPAVPPDTDEAETLPAPENFDIAIENRTAGASPYAVAVASWDALEEDFLRVQVQMKTAAQSTWTTIGQSDDGETELESGPLLDNTTYDFRARTIGPNSTSPYTATVTEFVTTDTSAPGALADVSVSSPGAGAATIDFRAPSSANVYVVTVHRGTSAVFGSSAVAANVPVAAGVAYTFADTGLAANTYYYWLIAKNGSGIPGPTSGPHSVAVS